MLTDEQLKSGRKGFVTHALCTKTFGGTHSDPGKHCPTEQLMDWAKEYAERLS